MDWIFDRAIRFLFGVAMFFSVGLAAAFAYFETASFHWIVTAGAMIGLAGFETVKATRATHVSDLIARKQWGRFAANMLLWLLLASFAFFMSFTAVNDHLFGVAVDKLGSEAQQVAQWQSDINDRKERRAKQVERAGGEPKTEEAAKEDLEAQMMANPKDWERSRQCELPLPETRSTCTKYKQLASALASSSAVAGLDREIAELSKKIEAASPEAREAAKVISDTPRPRGLKALGMIVGLVDSKGADQSDNKGADHSDSKGADLSVAYLALVFAITAEFISNFLAYALELKVPGMRREAAANPPKQSSQHAVENAPEGSSQSEPQDPPTGPSGGGGKSSQKSSRRSSQKSSQTPANTGLGRIRPPLRIVHPKSSQTRGWEDQIRAFLGRIPIERGREHSADQVWNDYLAWAQAYGDPPMTRNRFGRLVKANGFEAYKSCDVIYIDRRKPAANDEQPSAEAESA